MESMGTILWRSRQTPNTWSSSKFFFATTRKILRITQGVTSADFTERCAEYIGPPPFARMALPFATCYKTTNKCTTKNKNRNVDIQYFLHIVIIRRTTKQRGLSLPVPNRTTRCIHPRMDSSRTVERDVREGIVCPYQDSSKVFVVQCYDVAL